MAAEVTQLRGSDVVIERLDALPKKLKRKAAKVALRRGANIMRDDARSRAKRIDDRDTPPKIWKNIRTQEATRTGRRIGGVVMRVGVAGTALASKTKQERASLSAGLPGGSTQHWRFEEFGFKTGKRRTRFQKLRDKVLRREFGSREFPARPFLRPAMSQNIGAVTDKVATEIAAAIERLATAESGAA